MPVMFGFRTPVETAPAMAKRGGKGETTEIKALVLADEDFIRAAVRAAIQTALEAAMAEVLAAERSERMGSRIGYRSGF